MSSLLSYHIFSFFISNIFENFKFGRNFSKFTAGMGCRLVAVSVKIGGNRRLPIGKENTAPDSARSPSPAHVRARAVRDSRVPASGRFPLRKRAPASDLPYRPTWPHGKGSQQRAGELAANRARSFGEALWPGARRRRRRLLFPDHVGHGVVMSYR